MNRNELVEFLHTNYRIRKGSLNNIKNIVSAAYKEGFVVEKNGVDNFNIYEDAAVRDFTKPLRIVREIPRLSNIEAYNGVPVVPLMKEMWCGGWFCFQSWCYLANKQDGEYI
jgi:hypothetical protein